MQCFEGSKVFKGKIFASVLAIVSWWGVAPPAIAQVLVPHTVQLDEVDLQQQGQLLAEEAAQLARIGQFELAMPRAKLAAQLAPQDVRSWEILGRLYLQAEEVDQGISALERGRNLAPENAGILLALGSANFQKQNYQKAVEYLEAGLKINPDVTSAWFDLGNAYYLFNRLGDAIDRYEEAVSRDAQFWPAINNMGLVKYEQGDLDGALRKWREAANIDKEAAEPQLAIAVALYTKGEQEKGLATGEAALRLDPRYGDLDFLRENLWGSRLLKDTAKFLATPRIKTILAGSTGQ
ncbi:MAG TPA: tetratricopeptide repeat protein [Oscillatoriaceae cyanobacterium M33_DOE_052]|uniref:Tetratricopeptide repeat protein n=1 Tax=Planktothricoides sp. SpSt-374 TaxID=2282167 RepID=A0A7C3VPQ6_9CYAN|nr:tetratricopeptide repeat protein [Oscillatoriaceae cyanobacterium M33_DOE_052]